MKLCLFYISLWLDLPWYWFPDGSTIPSHCHVFRIGPGSLQNSATISTLWAMVPVISLLSLVTCGAPVTFMVNKAFDWRNLILLYQWHLLLLVHSEALLHCFQCCYWPHICTHPGQHTKHLQAPNQQSLIFSWSLLSQVSPEATHKQDLELHQLNRSTWSCCEPLLWHLKLDLSTCSLVHLK